jgi:hypothetical protein
MYKRHHVKYTLFLTDFNEGWIFSTDFRKILECLFFLNFVLWPLFLLLVFSPGTLWAGTRAQSGDRYGSDTLHPGQVLRGSLPLLPPPPSDIPTFATRYLHVRNDARDLSSERWNYGRQRLSDNFAYMASLFTPLGIFTCHKSTNGTDGFVSPPKERKQRIFRP